MKKITIENFKCFEYEEINLENLTVLAGVNGSGKSTVIQAILLLKQAQRQELVININTKIIPAIVLNGYYFQGGTVKDILFINAAKDIIGFAFENDKDTTIKFVFDIKEKKDARTILCANEINDADITTLDFFHDFDFISADRFGPRLYHPVSDIGYSVGKKGEFTPFVISENKNKLLEDEKTYFEKDDKKHTLLTEINKWLSHIIEGAVINAEIVPDANISLLKITNYREDLLDFKSPVHMPYGASYVLPIIVACLNRNKKGLTIVENPESHLHPSAQSNLGRFFAQMAASGRQIILETHSDHIINGIRLAIKEQIISHNDVVFNFFSKGKNIGEHDVQSLKASENGKLSHWPPGFLDQYEQDMLKLL
ncbi:MAG: DUF3696 domain-containing protein [Spirochaetales bacterium]|nr:DUF3696 domain-containing protein [Spirochaetales bacterium]